jgi:methionine-rich copper-binding protein CopC
MGPLRQTTVALAAACLAACAGNGMGLDSNGRPVSPGGGGGGPLTADFASIQSHVFTPICSVCHVGASAPQGLRLDASNSYQLLVGVPSTEVPGILRVKPGDPTHSYIIQKLQGTAAVGAQMPFGEAPLPASTIAVIAQWISDGALPAASAAVAHDFQISSVVPGDGERLGDPPPQIVVVFTHEVDATRVDPQAVRLIRTGATDHEEVAADEIAVTARLAVGNARALLITPRQPLGAGAYLLYVDAALGRELADVYGDRLTPESPALQPRAVVSFSVESAP